MSLFKPSVVSPALAAARRMAGQLTTRDFWSMLEASGDGIGIVNEDHILVYGNKALFDLHGIDDTARGRYLGFDWRTLYGERGQAQIDREVIPALANNGSWRGETRVLRQDGKIVHMDLTLNRLSDGGYFGTARDVTARVQAEQERNNYREKMFQTQKADTLVRMAGGIVHDFNNTLAAILGYADLIRDDAPLGSDTRRFAEQIISAGSGSRLLIDRIQLFSRTADLDVETLDLKEAVSAAIGLIKVGWPKTRPIVTEYAGAMLAVRAPRDRLVRLITDLMQNAADASADPLLPIRLASVVDVSKLTVGIRPPSPKIEMDGEGHYHIGFGSIDPKGHYGHLIIADQGHGIDPDILPLVAEPFFSTRETTAGQIGMGLPSAVGFVASLNGCLRIITKPGQGTLVLVSLPLSGEKSLRTGAASSTNAEPLLPLSANGTKVRILVVDDQATIRDMVRVMLTRAGFAVTGVASGREALTALGQSAETPFDLVLSDQNMPEMTGVDFADRVAALYPDMPIVLMTGYSKSQMQAELRDHPAVIAVVHKPLDRQSIIDTITTIIHQNRELT